MVRRETSKKIVGLTITAVVIILILTFLMPPSMAITLSPGTPNTTSVTVGQTITFSNVNISLEGIELIPITEINFTVYQGTNKIANVSFHVDGTEIYESTSNKFTVTLVAPTDFTGIFINDTYHDVGYGGSRWGDDPGFGYGYGNLSAEDINLSYTITYTTHTTGTFYAKLYAYTFFNSYTYIYNSTQSTSFTVATGGGGTPPGGDEGGDDEEPDEPEPDVTIPETTLEELETLYNIVLTEPFYGNDTNNDGIIDTFDDPNGVLTSITNLTINGNQTFLITTNDDPVPEFFWDTDSNTITPIEYAPGTVTDTFHDEESKTYTFVVTIEKNEWVYIEITDRFPPALYSNYTLVIQTPDGRNISEDRIWRQNNKIFILDDPEVEYYFIYEYDELPPFFFAPTVEFDPASGYTFVVQRPTITISFSKEVAIVTATLNSRDVRSSISTMDNRNFTFIPTYDVENGVQTLSITIIDSEGELYPFEATYTFEITDRPITIPWEIIVVVLVIVFVIIIFLVMFKTGFLYIEESPDKEEPEEPGPPIEDKVDEQIAEKTPEPALSEPEEEIPEEPQSEEPQPQEPSQPEPEQPADDERPPSQQTNDYQPSSWQQEPTKPSTLPPQFQAPYTPAPPSYTPPSAQPPVQQRAQPQYQPLYQSPQQQQKKPQQNTEEDQNTNN